MDILKHVCWELPQDGERPLRGRVGVKITNEKLAICTLAGTSLPANHLFPVLLEVGGMELFEEAEKLHRGRSFPWRVDVYTGMSGCRDYRLKYLRSEGWKNVPTGAFLHVSMYDVLNHNFSLRWLGDLPPLLAEVLRSYPPPERVFLDSAVLPGDTEGFTPVGESSGLLETIASLEAMEVLADAKDSD
ncbi:MAG: hypothetical protein WCZ10_14505 [Desulfobulbaceae bacterium]